MKKRFLFPMLLLPFLFLSCEFMCVKEVRDTYLLIDDVPNSSDIRVFCESEKLEVIKSTECIFVSDDEHFSY